MNELIQELLPYVKGFAGFYLVWNAIAGILGITFTIFIFSFIVKKHRDFDKEFKNRWK